MTGKRILVVDDEADIVETTKAILQQNQYEVTTASGGEEALGKIKQSMPDLIILDILMPRKDGLWFLQKIREEKTTFSVPIIFLTALQKKEEQVRGGFVPDGVRHRIFAKPFEPDELLEAIRELLNP
ncbi:MAG: response regulator [Candidatus Omnitrophica bacterium]|nr:response regulator [Candidatus Omnitrophota bacterium]